MYSQHKRTRSDFGAEEDFVCGRFKNGSDIGHQTMGLSSDEEDGFKNAISTTHFSMSQKRKRFGASPGDNCHNTICHSGSEKTTTAPKYDEACLFGLGKPRNFANEGQDNAINRGPGLSSEFKAVCCDSAHQKRKAQIEIDGSLDSDIDYEEEAAREEAARKYNGSAAFIDRPLIFASESQEQAVKRGSSIFKAVSWNKAHLKWHAHIRIDGKTKHLGYFDSEEAAARKYDEAAASIGRPRNFANDGQERAIKGGNTSKFKGVFWNKAIQKWTAQICIDGKKKILGLVDCEEAAARKYDETAASIGRPLNFANDDQERVIKLYSSKFKGVFWDKAIQEWRADIFIDGKRKHLGFFDAEEDAAHNYDEAAALIGRPLNFAIEGQEPEQAIKGGTTSKFKGVFWNKAIQKWTAQIRIDGKKKNLGLFDSEESVARKYDEAAASIDRPLNFASKSPQEGGQRKHDSESSESAPVCSESTDRSKHIIFFAEEGKDSEDDAESGEGTKDSRSTPFMGVRWELGRQRRWATYININGADRFIGSFDTAEEAARKYDTAAAYLGRKDANFPM